MTSEINEQLSIYDLPDNYGELVDANFGITLGGRAVHPDTIGMPEYADDAGIVRPEPQDSLPFASADWDAHPRRDPLAEKPEEPWRPGDTLRSRR